MALDAKHSHRLVNEAEILELPLETFNRKFKNSPLKRAKRRGYLRNVAVRIGNSGDESTIPAPEKAGKDAEPLVREHAEWALEN